MKLVPLFEMTYKYTESVRIGPIKGEQGADFLTWALREGTVTGERISRVHKAFNNPRRRTDNVMVPDARGVITTDDGESIFYELHGYGIDLQGVRHVTATIVYRTASEKYGWLNTAISVSEGRYHTDDDGRPVGVFRVYECVTEVD